MNILGVFFVGNVLHFSHLAAKFPVGNAVDGLKEANAMSHGRGAAV